MWESYSSFWNRLKPDAEDALWLARGCSRSSPRVRRWQAEHLLLMSLLEDAWPAARLLRTCGVNPTEVQREVLRRVKLSDAPGQTNSAATLELALDEASALGDKKIGTEHILLAILRSEGIANEVLRNLGVEANVIRAILTDQKKVEDHSVRPPSSAKPPAPDPD